MNVLGGILKRAQMQRWIAHNPAANVERIPVPKLSGDFNVLTPAQIEAVARAADGGWTPVAAGDRIADGRRATRVSDSHAQDLTRQRRADAILSAAAIRFAAYTGLRLGELRALRWRDVVWADSLVHVRLNAPSSAPAGSAERRPKSQVVRSVPLADEAAKAIEGSLGANFTRVRTTMSSQAQPAPSLTASACAMRSTARSSPPGSGSSAPRAMRSSFTTYGTPSARWPFASRR